MNTGMRATTLVALVVLGSAVLWGCSEGGCPFCVTADWTTSQPAAAGDVAEGGGVVLCGACGQIKGSESCCVADAETCEKCGLAVGSPGCCKIEKGSDVTLCSACGQIKGAEACCAIGAEKCAKCGLAVGSPGCCKIGS